MRNNAHAVINGGRTIVGPPPKCENHNEQREKTEMAHVVRRTMNNAIARQPRPAWAWPAVLGVLLCLGLAMFDCTTAQAARSNSTTDFHRDLGTRHSRRAELAGTVGRSTRAHPARAVNGHYLVLSNHDIRRGGLLDGPRTSADAMRRALSTPGGRTQGEVRYYQISFDNGRSAWRGFADVALGEPPRRVRTSPEGPSSPLKPPTPGLRSSPKGRWQPCESH